MTIILYNKTIISGPQGIYPKHDANNVTESTNWIIDYNYIEEEWIKKWHITYIFIILFLCISICKLVAFLEGEIELFSFP